MSIGDHNLSSSDGFNQHRSGVDGIWLRRLLEAHQVRSSELGCPIIIVAEVLGSVAHQSGLSSPKDRFQQSIFRSIAPSLYVLQ